MRGIEADGKRIGELRASLGFKQEELAARADCDVKTLRSAERGKRLDVDTLRRIAAALNVPAASIVAPAEPAEPQTQRRLNSVNRWQQAYNERDIDAMLACYHNDAVLIYPGSEGLPGSGRFRGKAQLRRQAELAFANFDMETVTPDMYRLHAVDNFVFLRGVASVTIRQTGVRFTAAAMHEFEFREDKIVRHEGFFDNLVIQKAVLTRKQKVRKRHGTSR